jgi:hypothetical protein
MAEHDGAAVISPDELAHIGRALFGDDWQAPLAKALDRSGRTVRELAAGERPVGGELVQDLIRLCTERRDKLARIAAQLEKLG